MGSTEKTGSSNTTAEKMVVAELKPYQLMTASCAGAFMTSLTMTPLDVVKIRLQTQQRHLLTNRCFLYCNGLMEHICMCSPAGTAHSQWYARPGHFTGTIDAFVKIARSEGPMSLWSGLPPTLVMAIPATMLYYTTYELSKQQLCSGTFCPLYITMASAAIARLTAATVVSPLELMRTKLQSKNLKYKELGEVLKQLMVQKGWRGLWIGLTPTLLRDIPFSMIYWCGYESLKEHFQQPEPTTQFSLFAGSVAGMMAAVVTLPFDVVKTHQQIEIGERQIYSDKPVAVRNLMAALKDIYRQQGVRGLFTGLGPRIAKVAPACAIMITSFEYGKKWFKKRNSMLMDTEEL